MAHRCISVHVLLKRTRKVPCRLQQLLAGADVKSKSGFHYRPTDAPGSLSRRESRDLAFQHQKRVFDLLRDSPNTRFLLNRPRSVRQLGPGFRAMAFWVRRSWQLNSHAEQLTQIFRQIGRFAGGYKISESHHAIVHASSSTVPYKRGKPWIDSLVFSESFVLTKSAIAPR